jgi:hypothetical protein
LAAARVPRRSLPAMARSSDRSRFDPVYVRWRPNPAEGKRCRTFPMIEAARDLRAQIDAEMARCLVIDPRAGRVLYRHFAKVELPRRV